MARPRKVILLIDSNELRRSLTRFMLDTRGFNVLAVESSEHARMAAAAPDCVLGYWPFDAQAAAGIAKSAFSPLVIVAKDELPIDVFASDVLSIPCSAARLVERMKMHCARKRGPRPQAPETLKAEAVVA